MSRAPCMYLVYTCVVNSDTRIIWSHSMTVDSAWTVLKLYSFYRHSFSLLFLISSFSFVNILISYLTGFM